MLVPPGEYTSGTLHLRSHVRIEIAFGATLFASADPDYTVRPEPAADVAAIPTDEAG